MSTKEIKSALKAAKNAIQSKDYETAIRHCDFILNSDASNYNALVFAGLCFSETGEIAKARERYQKAISVQPDQVLAFQGLANLYTKHLTRKKTDEEVQELVLVYEKLLSSTDRRDAKKRIDVFVNFCKVLIESDDLVKALEEISTEVKAFQDQDYNIRTPLYEEVFKVLSKVKEWKSLRKFSDLIDESFKSLVEAENDQAVSYLRLYLTYLRNSSDLLKPRVSHILDVCAKLAKNFPKEALPLETTLQAYVQTYEHSTLGDIGAILTALRDLGSNFADVGFAYQQYKNGDFEGMYKHLDSCMKDFSTFLPGWVTLSKTCLKLHKNAEARKYAKQGLLEHKQISCGSKPTWLLPLLSLEDVKFELSKCLAIGLARSHSNEDILNGIKTFQKLLSLRPDDVELRIGMSEGFVKLKKYSEALKTLNDAVAMQPDNPDVLAWTAYIKFKTTSAEDWISKLEAISTQTALSLFLLGKCLWEAGGEYRTDKKKCFAALVKAAKLDPYRGEIFFFLGQFYSHVQRDNARAKGCYQKAYQMDRQDQDAAACLADAYVGEGDNESAIRLYEELTKEVGSAGEKWVWLRLGLYKLKAKDITNAIQCFQFALRIDPDDSICWECLGEGYLQRGSFTAAWKAFDKAHQLNPHSVYSLYQMAKVKQVQGLYPEAIAEYTDVLELFSDYVPGLQGLGESQLLLARQMFHEGRFQTGIERLEKAVAFLTKACKIRKDLCCLWKLLGDCCGLIHSLDGSVVHMKIPSILLPQNTNLDTEELLNVGKSELLSLSTRFYSRVIQIQPENASLWHDLGVSYFRQAENGQKGEFGEKAMNAVKKAITLEPTNHVFWCSLGVIAASRFINDLALAQHCFLTSVKNEQNNVGAWSNLATLYLTHDHVKMAHEAFKVAQSLDPSFVNSWIGQAIIAETIGSSETMDLYRHSTELGLQKQGGTGYSSWVTRVITSLGDHDSAMFKENIRDMNAVTTATTQMSKLCNKNPRCSWSSTTHGILLEHSGLNRSAAVAYRSACNALESNLPSKDEDVSLEEKRKKAAINLARTLCKTGNFREAILFYKQAKENLDTYEKCGMALAYFKDGQFDQALKAYKQAGQTTTNEEEKSQIMVAIAMTLWKTGKTDEAKTALYQCFQSCKPGLQALLSLGIAVMDKTLVGAAVGEMMKKKSACLNEQEVTDDCLLIATAAKLCGDQKTALSELQKALHENPASSSLRVLLCRLLVDLDGCHGVCSTSLISNHAERLSKQECAKNPLHRDSELWKSTGRFEEGLVLQKSCAISSMASGNYRSEQQPGLKKKLLKAQVFAHMHPYEPSSWRLLSCACHASDVTKWTQGQEPKHGGLTSSLANYSLQLCESGNRDKNVEWVANICAWSAALSKTDIKIDDEVNSDLKFIKLLNEASRTRDKAKLQSVFKEVTSIMGKTSRPQQSSKFFAELLEMLSMFQVSRKMFEKSVSLVQNNNVEKRSLYFRLIRLMYHLSIKDESKNKELEAALKSVVADILKVDPRSPQSLLFQGLASRIEKNHRKLKSFLNRVLNSTEFMSDDTRTMAVWYLYRQLHERNDATEIEKLVSKALEMEDTRILRLMEQLPIS